MTGPVDGMDDMVSRLSESQLDLSGLYMDLVELLGHEVDLGTVKPRFCDRVLAEAVPL